MVRTGRPPKHEMRTLALLIVIVAVLIGTAIVSSPCRSDSRRPRMVKDDFARAAAAFDRYVREYGREPRGWEELEAGGIHRTAV